MKKKIYVGILATTMMLTMVACGDNKKDDKKDDKEENVTVEQQLDITPEDDISETDTTAEEGTAEQEAKRWLMTVDFSEETIAQPEPGLAYYVEDYNYETREYTPCEPITYPMDISYFDNYNIFWFKEEQDSQDYHLYSSLEEALADERALAMVEPGDSYSGIVCSLSDEKDSKGYMFMACGLNVINPTSESKTYKECIENGWFSIGDGYGDSAIGLSEDELDYMEDYTGDGFSDDNDTMCWILENWGPPTYVEFTDWDEDGAGVDDFIDSGASVELYTVGWEFEEYTILLYISDGYFNNKIKVGIEGSYYYDNEAWGVESDTNEMEEFLQSK